ncbi:MAG: TPM domain-containing protein [Bacillota bacterium]
MLKLLVGATATCLVAVAPAQRAGTALPMQLPDPVGFVNDFASLLSPFEAAHLEKLIREGELSTGAEVAVAIVNTVGNYSPKEYAVALFEKWGIGKKGADNGLLILLVMDQRRLEIEIGYGLEHIITDSTAGRIRDLYLVPKFRENKYAEGLELAVTEIYSLIRQSQQGGLQPPPQPETQSVPWQMLMLVLLFIAVWVSAVVFFVRRRHRCPVCGQPMRKKEVVARVATPIFPGLIVVTWSCANCGFSKSTQRTVRPSGTGSGWPGGWFGPGFPIGRTGGGSPGGRFGGFGGGRSGGGGAGGHW